jgi:hypothetical protein
MKQATDYADQMLGKDRTLRHANAGLANMNHRWAVKLADAIAFNKWDPIHEDLDAIQRGDSGLMGSEQFGQYSGWTRDMAAVGAELTTDGTLKARLESYVAACLSWQSLHQIQQPRSFVIHCENDTYKQDVKHLPNVPLIMPGSRALMGEPYPWAGGTYSRYWRWTTEAYHWMVHGSKINEGSNVISHPDFAMALVEVCVSRKKYNYAAQDYSQTKKWPLRSPVYFLPRIGNGWISIQQRDTFGTKLPIIVVDHDGKGNVETYTPVPYKSDEHEQGSEAKVSFSDNGEYKIEVLNKRGLVFNFQGQSKGGLYWSKKGIVPIASTSDTQIEPDIPILENPNRLEPSDWLMTSKPHQLTAFDNARVLEKKLKDQIENPYGVSATSFIKDLRDMRRRATRIVKALS